MDIAELGLRIENGSVVAVSRSLDDMGAAGERAGKRVAAGMAPVQKIAQDTQRAMQPLLLGFDQFASVTGGPATNAMQQFGRATRDGIGHAEKHALATGKMGRALEGLAFEALGANHHMGVLGITLAEFASGQGPVLVALGAVAGLGIAYEKLTEKAREEAKAQKEALDALHKFNEEQRAGGALQLQIEKVRDRIREVRKEIESPSVVQRLVNWLGAGSYGVGAALLGNSTSTAKGKAADAAGKEVAGAEENLAKKMRETTDAARLEVAQQLELNKAYADSSVELEVLRIFQQGIAKDKELAAQKDTEQLRVLNAQLSAGRQWGAVLADLADGTRKLAEKEEALGNLRLKLGQRATVFGLNMLAPQAAVWGNWQGGAGALPSPAVRSVTFGDDIVKNAERVTRETKAQADALRESVGLAAQLAEGFGLIGRDAARALSGIGELLANVRIARDAQSRVELFQGAATDAGKALFGQARTDLSAANLALAGGVVGILGGFASVVVGAGEAARRAHEYFKQLRETLDATTQSFRDQITQPDPITLAMRQFAAARKTIEEAFPHTPGMVGALNDAERERRLTEINVLEAARIAQLNAEAGAMAAAAKAAEDLARALAFDRSATDMLLSRLGVSGSGSFNRLQWQTWTNADGSAGGTDQTNRAWYDRAQAYADQIDEATRQTQLQQQMRAILDASLQVQKETLSKETEAANTLRRTVDALRSASDSLKLGGLSPLDANGRYLEAKAQYDRIAAQAAGGDQTAAGQLPDFANRFLEESRNMFASSTRYVEDYRQVQTFLGALTDQYGAQLTVQDRILAELQKQTAIEDRTAQNTAMAAVAAAIDRTLTWEDQVPAEGLLNQLRKLYPGLAIGVDTAGRGYLQNFDFRSPAEYWKWAYRNVPLDEVPSGTPGFASGGDHWGGLMRVGERGPELVATGRARVHTSDQLNAPVVAAIDRQTSRLESRIQRLEHALSLASEKIRANR